MQKVANAKTRSLKDCLVLSLQIPARARQISWHTRPGSTLKRSAVTQRWHSQNYVAAVLLQHDFIFLAYAISVENLPSSLPLKSTPDQHPVPPESNLQLGIIFHLDKIFLVVPLYTPDTVRILATLDDETFPL